MEQAASERWGEGDPDAYLDITADDVSYFDPFLNQRIDGIESLKKWYGAFRRKNTDLIRRDRAAPRAGRGRYLDFDDAVHQSQQRW